VTSNPVRISAHDGPRAQPEAGPLRAYRDALTAKADYAEVDIRRTADAELVALHDSRTSQGRWVSQLGYAQLCDLAGFEVPKIADILGVIKGRAMAHLDLKGAGYEDQLVRLALEVVGPGQFIITSPDDASVAAIRSRFPAVEDVPVALTLTVGRLTPGPAGKGAPQTRLSGLRPWSRLRACGADWVAVDHRLALAGVVRQCRRRHLKVMVWTVNGDRELRYWLSRQRVDVIVTDRPARAAALRGRTAQW
jgi:glycerophosphoryl diester phosphodiesterase